MGCSVLYVNLPLLVNCSLQQNPQIA